MKIELTSLSPSTLPLTSTQQQQQIEDIQTLNGMSKNLGNLLPIPSRILREEDPSSPLKFVRSGPKKQPRSQATWAHYYRRKSTRLVLTLDLSTEATEFRNKLKNKYFHQWGCFSDTRFSIIDPLPDRNFYVKMYKTAINEFCSSSPPVLPVGPTLNIFVSDEDMLSGLHPEKHPKGYTPPKNAPKEPVFGHFLVAMSLPKSSILHKLREHFLKEFLGLPNEEIQTSMKEMAEERFKAQIPLGFARDMGSKAADDALRGLVRDYKKTEGIHLGNAISLSLWRHHFDANPARNWDDPVLVNEECIYSRKFDGISQQPSFVSIAPEEELVKQTNGKASNEAKKVALESES
ncbi:hypothetical protein EYC84_010572 [Monilinia fructicola]|uniref:Uncharacterized protein n=1 Tax=Monilinia fructicola TaxID=38448 RepID=A0A5M9J6Q1_MONFR|nr:hypothetical protein EYC84_010572 [Monilinia fructicola]